MRFIVIQTRHFPNYNHRQYLCIDPPAVFWTSIRKDATVFDVTEDAIVELISGLDSIPVKLTKWETRQPTYSAAGSDQI